MTETFSKRDAIAFRLNAQNLTERRDESGLLTAASRCGVQNSPPGSGLLALHARVENMTPDILDKVISEDRSLLQTWSMRGAPFYFATADAPVFTAGVLPTSETARRHFVLGVDKALDTLGMSLAEVVEAISAGIREVLRGRRLAINELGAELAERVATGLPATQRRIWEGSGPYAQNQRLGEGVVHFCIRVLTVQGIVCFAPRTGNQAPFVLVDEWLGRPLPETDPRLARAELVRRYLRCYGPTTRKDFAAWLGVFTGDIDPWWSLVEDELARIEFNGVQAWILTEDLAALRESPMPEGVRLLPPRDPYTQLRDRESIVDKKHHRKIWKPVGEPGTVMVDGEITGIWRPRKTGRKLAMTISTFGSLRDNAKQSLIHEAEQIALLRGASSSTVEFAAL